MEINPDWYEYVETSREVYMSKKGFKQKPGFDLTVGRKPVKECVHKRITKQCNICDTSETIHGKYRVDTIHSLGVPLTNKLRKVYVIGSLRNPQVPEIAQDIREQTGMDVFDDWFSAGPEADDYWKRYEQEKGNDYITALGGAAARNVFEFDKRHLDAADDVVLVLPAGKSGHLELGYCAGKGKRTYIILEADADPRWDVMMQFADFVVPTVQALIGALNGETTYALR